MRLFLRVVYVPKYSNTFFNCGNNKKNNIENVASGRQAEAEVTELKAYANVTANTFYAGTLGGNSATCTFH